MFLFSLIMFHLKDVFFQKNLGIYHVFFKISIKYNETLAITGAIQGTSKDKLYKELGLE